MTTMKMIGSAAAKFAALILGCAALCASTVHAAGFDGKSLMTNDWFDVGFTAGTSITKDSNTGFTPGTGSWTAVPADGVEIVDAATDYLSIDADDLLTLTPSALASSVSNETVAVKVKANVITSLDNPEDPPIAAFALYDNGTTVTPVAYVDGGWTNLVYANAADLTNAWFTLYIDFSNDNDQKSVRFSVQPDGGAVTVLKDSQDATWFASGSSSATKISSLSFSGSGLCQTISGDSIGFAVAEVNGTRYESFEAAITAADAAGVSTITILNGAAVSPNADWKVVNGQLVKKVYVAQVVHNDVAGESYESIQDAIDAAAAGDTINVFAGTYTIDNTINVTKSVTITGAGKDVTVLNGTTDSGIKGGAVFKVAASNVTIKDMTLYQADTATYNTCHVSIDKAGTDACYSNVVLQGLKLANGMYSIFALGESFSIVDCDFSTTSTAILIDCTRGNSFITGNTFTMPVNTKTDAIKWRNNPSMACSGSLTINENVYDGDTAKYQCFFTFCENAGASTTGAALSIISNVVNKASNKAVVFDCGSSHNMDDCFSSVKINYNAFIDTASGRPVLRRDDANTSGLTIDATYNYWDTADPAVFATLIQADVAGQDINTDYKPYYVTYENGELSDLRPLVAAVVTDSGATTNSYGSLQAAVDAAYELTGDVTVALLSDTAEKVKINQKDGLDLTVDGDGKTVTGQLLVYGKSSVNAVRTDTLTIKGFNFTGTEDDVANNTAYIMFEGKDYAHNITITNCTFTSEVAPYLSKPAMKGFATSINNIKMYDLHAEKVHSFAQIFDATNVVIAGCSLSNSKNGLNLNLTRNGTSVISDTSIAAIDSEAYGVRLQGSGYGVVRLLSGVTIDAAEALVAGNTSEQVPLNNGNFLVEDGFYKGVLTQKVANCTFYITGGYFSEVPAAAFIAPGYTVIDNTDPATKDAYPYTVGVVPPVAEAYDAEGGTLIGQFATVNEAIAAAGATYVKLLDNVTLTAPLTMTSSYTLDFNGKTIYYNTTATTVINGSSNIIFKNGKLDISSCAISSSTDQGLLIFKEAIAKPRRCEVL